VRQAQRAMNMYKPCQPFVVIAVERCVLASQYGSTWASCVRQIDVRARAHPPCPYSEPVNQAATAGY
jgi:hypothetical protein